MITTKKLQEQIYKLKTHSDKELFVDIFKDRLRKINLCPEKKPENRELRIMLLNKKMEKLIDTTIIDTWEF